MIKNKTINFKPHKDMFIILVHLLIVSIVTLCFILTIMLAFSNVYALSIPSDVKVIEVYRPNAWYCGYYHFGGKIIINKIPLCMESIGYDNIIEHELIHHEYFKKPIKERLRICKSYGMKYNTECWEEYVTRSKLEVISSKYK